MSPAQRLHAIDLHTVDQAAAPELSPNLDPANWSATRAQAHAMLDDMLDYIRDIRARPVWQPIPSSARAPVP